MIELQRRYNLMIKNAIVFCFTGVGASAGVGVMALGATGIYSACR